MNHKFSRTRIISLLLPLLLAACGGLLTQQPAQPIRSLEGATAVPTTTTAPVASATPVAGLETPVLMCTPPACTPGEVYACPTGDCPGGCGTVCAAPTPITGPLAAAPTDWESLEEWLTTLWRGGVNPAAVRAALQQSGMQRSLDDWHAADLDGDLRDEWVLVLYDQSLPGVPFGAPGDLWIVNDEVVFRYYTAPSSDIYEFIAPTIIGLTDMTGDGLPELIADATFCGAHTCTNNYRIIGSLGGQFTDLQFVAPQPAEEVAGDSPAPIAMSYADARLEDADGDGLPELLVHGGTIGSAGAGVVRPRTEVWGWDGAGVVLAETILDPTAYRHHVLYEANDLMAAGDLDGALALYEAAINDGALRNDGFSYSPEQTYADVSMFAAFRLILIDLLQGNAERANSRLAWLGATYPESVAARAAGQLIAEWAGPENAASLCDRIETNLLSIDNPTGALADMGYGNPSLGAGDFCP
jgi:hypothetical protein